MPDKTHRLAVLIDAENAQSALLDELFAEIAKFGVAGVKRAYGDFTHKTLSSWPTRLLDHAIRPGQQFNYTPGKNASDIALIIDAMDLLHSKRVDGFCLVSSDSDFTGLANRIREEGLLVYGFGERKTPKSFVNACDKFIHVENLRRDAKTSDQAETAPASTSSKKPMPNDLLKDAVESSADDSGWAPLSKVGKILNNRLPDFDVRSYGHKTLASLIEAAKGIALERRGAKGGTKQVFARVKSD